MKRVRIGRRPAAPASLSQPDRDIIVNLLVGAWTTACCEYRRADIEGRQHLIAVMDGITDALKTLGESCEHQN